MALTREQKKEYVQALNRQFENTPLMAFARYKGLKVVELTALRKQLAPLKGEAHVAKNTLLGRALQNQGLQLEQSLLDEPLLIVSGLADQAAVAKVLKKFSQEHPALEVACGLLAGQSVSSKTFAQLASLPSRPELEAQFVGMLAAPLAGLVNVLSATMRNLISVLSQYQMQREQSKA